MVGKPNVPDAGDGRSDRRGAARPTPGLAALDEEREASMADEGGASGAAMESEDESAIPRILPDPDAGRRRRARAFITGGAAGLFAMWALRRGVMAATKIRAKRVQNAGA